MTSCIPAEGLGPTPCHSSELAQQLKLLLETDQTHSPLIHLTPTCFFLCQQRVEIHKLRQGENLILGFSIGGGIDQDPSQNPFSEDKTDKVRGLGSHTSLWATEG